MTPEEAWDQVCYIGDTCEAPDGQNDLRVVCAKVVSLLPEEVQDWLLYETTHLFVGGSGQLAEFSPVHLSAKGNEPLRVIFLSERLMLRPFEEAAWTVAHEIAHSRCFHPSGTLEAEKEADALAAKWGFTPPTDRAEVLEQHYATRPRDKGQANSG